MTASPKSPEELHAAVAQNQTWYHTIDLGGGVLTPGIIDLRRAADRVLPDDMSSVRALDVGTFDGFWAFAMEERGADVVAIDVSAIDHAEWPPHKREELVGSADAAGIELGRGFAIAAAARDSKATRITCNFYDLASEKVGGDFDFVFAGAILLHLRDPVRAIERVRTVLRRSGELRVLEPFSLGLTLRSPRRPAASYQPLQTPFNWWVPNLACLDAWMATGQMSRVRHIGIMRPSGSRDMRQIQVARAYRRVD